MSDIRNWLARARDDYFEGDGKSSLEGSAEGQYLKNRLEKAFLAGIKAREKESALEKLCNCERCITARLAREGATT